MTDITQDIADTEALIREVRAQTGTDVTVLFSVDRISRILAALKEAQAKSREAALSALTAEGQAWDACGALEKAEARLARAVELLKEAPEGGNHESPFGAKVLAFLSEVGK